MAARNKINIFKETVSEPDKKPSKNSLFGFTNLVALKTQSHFLYRSSSASSEAAKTPQPKTVEDEIKFWQEINQNYCKEQINNQTYTEQQFLTQRQPRSEEESAQFPNIKPAELVSAENLTSENSRISFSGFVQALLVIANLLMSLQIFFLLKNF